MTRWVCHLLLFTACLLQSFQSTAGDSPPRLPPKLRVAILFKALSYDNNLKQRCGSSLRIGVLHGAGEEDRRDARQMVAEIRSNTDRTVKGLRIEVVDLEVHDQGQMEESLVESGVNTVYLSSGLDRLLPALCRTASRRKLVLMAGEARQVWKGASLGAVLQDSKPRILIHVERAREQGVDFDARLLRLADVVHDGR